MLALILAIAILGLIIWWFRAKKSRGRGLRSGGRQGFASLEGRAGGKVSAKVRRDLIRIAGNSQVAQRLVSNLRRKHPGKPENWYWEKAIFDLERDRHY